MISIIKPCGVGLGYGFGAGLGQLLKQHLIDNTTPTGILRVIKIQKINTPEEGETDMVKDGYDVNIDDLENELPEDVDEYEEEDEEFDLDEIPDEEEDLDDIEDFDVEDLDEEDEDVEEEDVEEEDVEEEDFEGIDDEF